MSQTSQSLYDRLQRNLDFLEETKQRVENDELAGLPPFDDVLAMCKTIEDAPADISWQMREDIEKMVIHLDGLVASIKGYETALQVNKS